MKYISQIDEKMREFVLTLRNPVLDEMLLNITFLGKWYILLSGVALISIWLLKQRYVREMFFLLAVALGTFFTVAGLKYGIGRARPEDPLALAVSTTPSFPSMHAALSFAVFTALAILWADRVENIYAKVALYISAGVLVVVVGTSRVYLGVHFFSDVLAGWIIASLVLAVGYTYFKRG